MSAEKKNAQMSVVTARSRLTWQSGKRRHLIFASGKAPALSCAPTGRTVDFELSERCTYHTVTNASFSVDEGSPVFTMSMLCAPSLRLQPCSIRATRGSKRGGRAPRCVANDSRPEKPASTEKAPRGRRELMLNGSSMLVLGGLLDNALGLSLIHI